MKRKNEEELVEELVEAAKHLLDQFPETDLGYPSAMVDYEGEWVEGVVDDQVVWALNNLREKLEALDESQAKN
jgi:hypothetical protein